MFKKLQLYSLIHFIPMCLFIAFPPVYAEKQHLFPSDIIDPSERSIYEQERSQRYASQREWLYPEEKTYPEPVYSDRNQFKSPPKNHDYSHLNYPVSEHHKYGNFNTENPALHFDRMKNNSQTGTQHSQSIYSSPGRQSYHANKTDVGEYGVPKYNKHHPTSYQVPAKSYYSDAYDTGLGNNNFLFPGDIEPKTPQLKKNIGKHHEQPEKSEGHQQANDNIRYVPVPVYGVPGTLPGTVPGVVTPSNMVPGYSHLSPYGYNSGIYNYPSNNYLYYGLHRNPYNSLGHFGTMPFLSDPFNPFANNYGNSLMPGMPFSYPGFLSPGLSVPENLGLTE